MGYWGYNSNQNDNALDYFEDLVEDYKNLIDENDEEEVNELYKKIFKYKKLLKIKSDDPEIILGVCLILATKEIPIILGNNLSFWAKRYKLPTSLPSNYPQKYKDLALNAISKLEKQKDNMEVERRKAFEQEVKLFSNVSGGY